MVIEIENGGEFVASVAEAKFKSERLNNIRLIFGNITKGCPCGRKKRRRHFEEAYRSLILQLTEEEKIELSDFFKGVHSDPLVDPALLGDETVPAPQVKLMSENMILLELRND